MNRRGRVAAEELSRTAERRSRWFRGLAFAFVTLIVLGAGVYLATGVFLGPRGSTDVAAALPMRISMAGFDPAVIHAKPGETVALDWWNTDGPMHLQGGVHTLVSETLGLRFELDAQSRRTITLTAPMMPGDYDFWCDSCCGGRASPAMHGTLRVES
jgi:cytochrome c oxidase subunit 2